MKNIHLLCNAHLDPVWQWQRSEGVCEAISTIRVAASFCEEFDGFVFNHNESLLYEWVEQYEPSLFERIKRLVKEGKWKIMGGWYLQPDCLIPCGESFIRQIEVGNSYFMKKFRVRPETAINFDSFGHSRGLVQILTKSGYNSYVFMRPGNFVPEHDFIWKGYDGSCVYGHCINGGYNTHCNAVDRIDAAIKNEKSQTNLILWGIGDHGGGPSKTELEQIEEYRRTHTDISIIHSWCENYFKESDKEALKVIDTSLVHCMVGCYTSMVRIKQMHRKLENEILLCEKMLAASGVDYDKNLLKEAEKALLFCQFHDILPGSMVKKSEEEALRLLNYGSEITSRLCLKAFFKLCEGQKEGKQGEIPLIIFNPHPYEIEEEIEHEFQLQDQNWTPNQITTVRVRTAEGEYLTAQNEKESSTIPLDWRKRVSFRAKLKPMSITRFDLELTHLNVAKRIIEPCEQNESHFILNNCKRELLINKKTGLIDKYIVNGINYLNENSCQIGVYKDNEDPWGMTVDGFYDKLGNFVTLSADEANAFNGYPDFMDENVRVIENGSVRTKIQAVFRHNNSYAVMEYTVPKKDTYIDIKIKIISNDVNVLYKLGFNTTISDGEFIGQQVFGHESMHMDEKEAVFQKWCGLFNKERGFAVINKGTHGGCAKNNTLKLTLMRTPVYCAHPINGRETTDHDRSYDHIDIGEREFEYRIMPDNGTLDKEAEVYNQPIFSLSFFPDGTGNKRYTEVVVDNAEIILSRYYENDKGELIIRLFNTKNYNNSTIFIIDDKSNRVEFMPFEFKTFVCKNGAITECKLL